MYRHTHMLQVGDGPTLCMVALAPLMDTSSRTMRRYETWARAWGYGRVLAVNVHPIIVDAQCRGLDAWIKAPDKTAAAANREAVMAAAHDARSVVACWGAGERSRSPARDALMTSSIPLYCIGVTADGSPRHPSGRALPSLPSLSVYRCPTCDGRRQVYSDPGTSFAPRWIDCPTCSNPLRRTPPRQAA